MGDDADYRFKLILLGNIDVGKTSLILRFTENTFSDEIAGEIDLKTRDLKINGKTVKLIITDTAGQERFRTLTSSYYRNADASLLCTRLMTANLLEMWMVILMKETAIRNVQRNSLWGIRVIYQPKLYLPNKAKHSQTNSDYLSLKLVLRMELKSINYLRQWPINCWNRQQTQNQHQRVEEAVLQLKLVGAPKNLPLKKEASVAYCEENGARCIALYIYHLSLPVRLLSQKMFFSIILRILSLII